MRAYQLVALMSALNGGLPRSDDVSEMDTAKAVSAQECTSMKTSVMLLIERAGRHRQENLRKYLLSAERALSKAAEAKDK